jgi:hypothetical protein
MGLRNLVLVSIFIVTYPSKACENVLPMTLDSNWLDLAIVKYEVLKFYVF